MKHQFILISVAVFLLMVLGWYLDSIARHEITTAIRLLIYALTFTVVTILFSLLVFSILMIRERLLKERANRRVKEREAKVMVLVAGEGQQVYIRDADTSMTWRTAHLDGRVYANGQRTVPNQTELIAWQTYMLRHRANVMNTVTPQLLPTIAQVDLLAALDNVQRCLIVGASDSGKTTLLRWLVSRRLARSKVIVIDPHAYPQKWPACIMVGMGRNYPEIGKALDALVRLMTKRYEEIGKGIVAEQGHSRITIFIDEWRAIVYNVKQSSDAIKALLTESRKAAFSVFVATHSDRAKPLGLEGEYDLKDGFAIVRLSGANGQWQATLDTGNGEIPVTLPGAYPAQNPPILDTDEFIKLEPEPTSEEIRILELYDAGESISAIATAVFGSKGGPQNKRVEAILNRFKRV
ncbi:MAG: hypothetical protein BroJett011_77150 [Chloroflexota bacterium]|nr:MAG: hypothetical protein BroJett011_77150 [Chloroflexota bacterium]